MPEETPELEEALDHCEAEVRRIGSATYMSVKVAHMKLFLDFIQDSLLPNDEPE